MAPFVDLYDHLPELDGLFLHAWPEQEADRLLAVLDRLRFRQLLIDTRADEHGFLDGLAAALDLDEPPNIDAANDLIFDWAAKAHAQPLAVVWRGADAAAGRDFQAFLDALWVLEALVPAKGDEAQCDVFLLGAGPAYRLRST